MTSDASLGGASYELDLDTSTFKAKATEAGNFLQTVIAVAAGVEFQKLADDFKEVGQELYDMVVEFGHATVDIQNMAQVTEEEAAKIADAMLEMSRQSLFGATSIVVAFSSVAGRLETLLGRQVEVTDATVLMKAATDLATASQQDLGSSTNALISVMLAYKIPLSDVATASDQLFNISRLTGVGFDTLTLAANRLRERLGSAAPDLGTMGALLAELNQQGLTGNRGLLVLVSGVNELTSGSKNATNELNRLGVGVYDANGVFVGFRSVIEQLQKAYAGMSPEQQKMSADLLFTKQSANIFLGLIQGGTKTLDDFAARIDKSGTAAAGAEAHIKDLKGQTELLRNNLEATAITMGSKLEPAVLKLVSAINPLLETISKNQTAMEAIAIIAAGVLVTGLLAVAAVTWTVVGGFVAMFIAENAALLGIPILIAIVVASLVLLVQHFDEISSWFKGGGWIDIGLALVFPFVEGIKLITEHWGALFDALPGPVQNFVIKVLAMIDTMVNGFLGAARIIASAFDDLDPTGHLNTAGMIPSDINLAGPAQAHQSAVNAHNARVSEQQAVADERANAAANRRKGLGGTETTGGAPVVPTPYPETAKKPSQGELDLLALAAAFAVFQAQTGGSLEDFMVFIKLQKDNIDLTQRQRDVMTALNVSTMELNNKNYQLRLTFVQLAEEAVRTGRSLQSVIADTFRSIGDKAKSLLDQLLNGPTREGTELQLRIDRLTRQADLLTRGGADESRLANIGKKGTPQPTGADRELKSIDDQIKALQLEQKIRQDDLAIMKDQAILANKNLQTDRDVANANQFLDTVIGNLTGTVKRLDDAMGGLIARLATALGIPQFSGGISYVPQKMLAVLDPGEAVLTAQENASRSGGGGGGFSIQNYFTINADMSDEAVNRLAAKVEQAGDRSIQRAMRRGSMVPSGSNSGR